MNATPHAKAEAGVIRSIGRAFEKGGHIDGHDAIQFVTGLSLGDDWAFAEQAAEYVWKKLGVTKSPVTNDYLMTPAQFEEFVSQFSALNCRKV